MAHRGTTLVLFLILILTLTAPLAWQSGISSSPVAAQSASPVAATPVAVVLPTAADLGISLLTGIDVTILAADPSESPTEKRHWSQTLLRFFL